MTRAASVGEVEAERYFRLVSTISSGKHVREAVYLHESALRHVDEELQLVVAAAVKSAGVETPWNVVKLSLDAPRLSLL